MYDLHQSRHNYEEFDLFTLDDIDVAFEKITQIKYNQSFALKGKGHGLVIHALPSGHIIGGTIWKIVKDNEEDIVYAVDYNHKRERHLNACYLENIVRPSLLITDCFNAAYRQERRKERDEQLMTNILSTVRQGGNVLIAVDTAGRVLELAHMLDQLWRTPGSGLIAYSLALLNTVAYNVIEFAKSQVEWMSDKIMKSFEVQRNNPFNFKHLKLVHSMAELDKIKAPMVVLASQPDLECGFARELFFKWAINPKNSIILTQRSSPYTLSSRLIKMAAGKTWKDTADYSDPAKRLMTFDIKQRVELEGKELDEYNENQRIKKELDDSKNLQNKFTEENDFDSEEDADETLDADTEQMDYSGTIFVEKPEKRPTAANQLDQLKHSINVRKTFSMYPLVEHKIKWDDYGELINPKDYILFEKLEQKLAEFDAANAKDKSLLSEDQILAQDVPTKCIIKYETFSVNANLQFIDFEGRSDGESIKKIIERIKPRRLILVRGDHESTNSMYNFCLQNLNLGPDKIFTPRTTELVDATTERNIYQVRLMDSLVSSLRFAKAKDGAELCWVEAAIEFEDNNEEMKEELNDQGRIVSRDKLPVLRPLPAEEMSSHVTIFVNELKLSDFKQVLLRNGIQAEFHGGVLYINNKVCVRRNEAGRINLEGTLCDDYFKVRQLLYGQYAII